MITGTVAICIPRKNSVRPTRTPVRLCHSTPTYLAQMEMNKEAEMTADEAARQAKDVLPSDVTILGSKHKASPSTQNGSPHISPPSFFRSHRIGQAATKGKHLKQLLTIHRVDTVQSRSKYQLTRLRTDSWRLFRLIETKERSFRHSPKVDPDTACGNRRIIDRPLQPSTHCASFW